MKTEEMSSKNQKDQGKENVIYLDDRAETNPDCELRFLEEIRRDKNGEIIAYVLKRNPNYRK